MNLFSLWKGFLLLGIGLLLFYAPLFLPDCVNPQSLCALLSPLFPVGGMLLSGLSLVLMFLQMQSQQAEKLYGKDRQLGRKTEELQNLGKRL